MKTFTTKGRKGNMLRRIAVVTGTRAEYGLLKSTMTALAERERVELQIVVTGAHLLKKFGHTVDEIEGDGWRIDATIAMQRGDDSPLDQSAGLSRGIAGISRFLVKKGTDIVVVLGDRIEAMAGALAAVTSGRILAHIHGGDLAAGDLDDRLRHAITKLAHLHFPATAEAARRIVRMGEESFRVHVVGAPGLDRLKEIAESGSKAKARSRQSPGPRHAIVVQHPCGRSAARERQVMGHVLEACEKEKLHVTCLYPNTDAGHRGILEAIEERRRSARNGEFRALATMPRDDFLMALHRADVLVGNSSSGIIESPFVGTAAVDIGDRQKGRQVGGPSVIRCRESPTAIRAALRKALSLRPGRASNAYGDGDAGKRIARVLSQVRLTEPLRRKLNRY